MNPSPSPPTPPQVETATGEVGRLVTGETGHQSPVERPELPAASAVAARRVHHLQQRIRTVLGGYGVNNSAQSINGSRTDTFSWNVDGADNKDNGGGGNKLRQH